MANTYRHAARTTRHARTHTVARATHTHTHTCTHARTHTQRTHIYQVLHHCIGNVGTVHPINCTNTRTRISDCLLGWPTAPPADEFFGVCKRFCGREKAPLPTTSPCGQLPGVNMISDTNVSWQAHCWLFPMCVCVCRTDSDKVFCISQYMYTYVYVSYCMLFYWSLLCSHKANFDVIHRQ